VLTKTKGANMIKCTECQSTNLEYLPDVDGQSWVRHYYEQTQNGKWKLVAKGDRATSKDLNGEDDVSLIAARDIFYNDGMSFFYCRDCTSELDGRHL
jgi:hypothetical protein